MFKKIILGLVLAIGATTLNAQDTDIAASQSYDASYNDMAYSAPAFPVGERMKGRVYSNDVMFVFAPLYQTYNGYIGYYYHIKKGDRHSNRKYIDSQWNVYSSKGKYLGQFYFPSDGDMYEIFYRDSKNDFGVRIFGNWSKYTYNVYAP